MMRAPHRQPGFVAALLQRLSGIALAAFLPLHFLALASALRGADALDSILAVTRHPLVKAAECGLVLALARAFSLSNGCRGANAPPRRCPSVSARRSPSASPSWSMRRGDRSAVGRGGRPCFGDHAFDA